MVMQEINYDFEAKNDSSLVSSLSLNKRLSYEEESFILPSDLLPGFMSYDNEFG